MPGPSIAAIILTRNEAKHIARCIDSLRTACNEVYVVDSYSDDETAMLAGDLGATVVQNGWINYSTQFNWALDHLPISSDWVLRIDADETLSPHLAESLKSQLNDLPADVAGAYVARRIHFLGKWIRHGGIYPLWHLRVWRRGHGRCEQRWMDEHIVLYSGQVQKIRGDIIDDNLNSLTWWTAKHNSYASREAVDLLLVKHSAASVPTISMAQAQNSQAAKKRVVKEQFYVRLPLGLRALAYFIFRYFFQLGFLDGFRGTIFHVLQGFWYRFLVDAKVFEVERWSGRSGRSIEQSVRDVLGIELEHKT